MHDVSLATWSQRRRYHIKVFGVTSTSHRQTFKCDQHPPDSLQHLLINTPVLTSPDHWRPNPLPIQSMLHLPTTASATILFGNSPYGTTPLLPIPRSRSRSTMLLAMATTPRILRRGRDLQTTALEVVTSMLLRSHYSTSSETLKLPSHHSTASGTLKLPSHHHLPTLSASG